MFSGSIGARFPIETDEESGSKGETLLDERDGATWRSGRGPTMACVHTTRPFPRLRETQRAWRWRRKGEKKSCKERVGNTWALEAHKGEQSAWTDAVEGLLLQRRKLEVAVADEDYLAAAKIRDETEKMESKLTTVQNLQVELLRRLQIGSKQDRLEACQRLAELGTGPIVSILVQRLTAEESQEVRQAVEVTIWSIFHRHEDSQVRQLMEVGTALMAAPNGLARAREVFSEMIQMDGNFAEAFNKRATCSYLLKDYEASIEDCKKTLELQPNHFGAMSGMGLCYLGLDRPQDALRAFKDALKTHPGLPQIREYCRKIEENAEGKQD